MKSNSSQSTIQKRNYHIEPEFLKTRGFLLQKVQAVIISHQRVQSIPHYEQDNYSEGLQCSLL